MEEVHEYGNIALQEMDMALERSRSVLYGLFGEVAGEQIRTNQALRPLVSRVIETKGQDLYALTALQTAADLGPEASTVEESLSRRQRNFVISQEKPCI
jgi:hypothetical protein